MAVIAGWLVPHPPLIFPEVGRGKQNEINDTVTAYRAAADSIAKAAPDTIVIISPHAPMYADYFHIAPGAGDSGDMKAFGVPGVKIQATYDTEFIEELARGCAAAGFPAGTEGAKKKGLDHGASIPVRFINDAYNPKDTTQKEPSPLCPCPKYVITGVSGLPLADHYRFGVLISETAERLGRKTVVIASGDLSHRLKDEGPYGFSPEGPEYDKLIRAIGADADFSRLFDMDEGFLENAGECGHRPLTVLAGALDRKAIAAKPLSYEGPFGVGYCLASFTVSAASGTDEGRAFLDAYLDSEQKRAEERIQNESPHVNLARRTVENFVRTGRLYQSPEPLDDALASGRAGVFVSIKKQGQLRGCIGTISPVTESIGEEIRSNAVSAASRDPRFDIIGEDELPYLEYSVDVLAPAEDIDSEDELDPAKYGVIVSLGGKRGLLLPDLEGIDDAGTQVSIAMRKAGIRESDRQRVKLERFEVIRYR